MNNRQLGKFILTFGIAKQKLKKRMFDSLKRFTTEYTIYTCILSKTTNGLQTVRDEGDMAQT